MTGFLKLLAPVCIFLCFIDCGKANNVNPPVTTIIPDSTAPVTDSFPENKVNRTALLRLVNGLRSRGCNCGTDKMPPVPTLTWSITLEKAAWRHSRDMDSLHYFDHNSLDGTTPGQRLDAAGYHWMYYGENIAKGQMDEQAVVLGWLNSPKHCHNMMDANVKELGVGKFNIYWTMELGSKK
ncbi:MAG TPA: CAP domain-containing protein [Chitinophaga sp.]|uniref:CAP domain-containing protein n=1 Tax=Chitinophaga sp. TaxID=1869181 RepID=UPI002DB86103|nr:CAP domain-containing protein [Chitinophaga sp.]HEU4554713.1 CAP domain-containing protein [Chitinophaga sp.]